MEIAKLRAKCSRRKICSQKREGPKQSHSWDASTLVITQSLQRFAWTGRAGLTNAKKQPEPGRVVGSHLGVRSFIT